MSNRVDELLSKLLNGETSDITPQSRIEAYLKALVDGSGTDGLPTPQSSSEAYFYALVEQGLGGGGGGEKLMFTDFSGFFNGGSRLEHLYDIDTSNGTDFSSAFRDCGTLTSISELDVSKGTDFSSMFRDCLALRTLPVLDTRNGTTFDYMFSSCNNLRTIQGLDTRNGTSFDHMFSYCTALTSVPEPFDTGNATIFYSMFANCSNLASIPELNTSKGTDFRTMFSSTKGLFEIPVLDTRKGTKFGNMFGSSNVITIRGLYLDSATAVTDMFVSCKHLTNLYLYNIKTNLTIGSGTSYGHLLTLDSLIHTIRELRDAESSRTLTMGSENLAKLADVYVREIAITDEMRAEDDLIDEKLPFEVCESTDEGATLITEYVLYKNWQLK